MLKKNLKILIITSIVILLPIAAGLILWNSLPEQLPVHWNAQGEVDGYMGKPYAIFALPLFLLVLHWVCAFVTSADPKRANHAKGLIHLVLWLLPIISVVLSAITFSVSLGSGVRIERVLPLIVGFVLFVLGIYLPKCRQNYTVGIKLPWTLHSEENWNKTHLLAGWIWGASGVVIAISGIFGLFWLMIAVFPVMVLVPLIYSYVLYRKGI